MAQLATRRPGRLVSVSRGVTAGWPRQESAEYLQGDVRDRARLDEIIAQVRPDVIFHVAAQRSPALAEVEVHRTVTTNVLGSHNVLGAARAFGVPQVVCASTGKALRPYSPEMYTASKRAAEWAGAAIARSSAGGTRFSAARFTHVVDNSIVHSRLRSWALDRGSAMRLHGQEVSFYAQSAVESAQLLLIAMLGAADGEFRVHAISDLGWPVSLLDVAVGVLRETRSATPLYISGYDPGYEEVAFPGLYDPATAGGVSPLLNAFEAAAAVPAACPRTDSFRLEMAPVPTASKLLTALGDVCAGPREDNDAARQALDEFSWSVLDATLAAASRETLSRCATLVSRHEETMSSAHLRIARAVRDHEADACVG
jgi:nucleoside-diphosphate-sugar epimerase